MTARFRTKGFDVRARSRQRMPSFAPSAGRRSRSLWYAGLPDARPSMIPSQKATVAQESALPADSSAYGRRCDGLSPTAIATSMRAMTSRRATIIVLSDEGRVHRWRKRVGSRRADGHRIGGNLRGFRLAFRRRDPGAAGEQDKVQIVFDGVDIHCEDGPAVFRFLLPIRASSRWRTPRRIAFPTSRLTCWRKARMSRMRLFTAKPT